MERIYTKCKHTQLDAFGQHVGDRNPQACEGKIGNTYTNFHSHEVWCKGNNGWILLTTTIKQ
ncbi:MAG: hypothetical protein HAW67_08395 [Endozoicomonadaceae bacterium]|nr:hypothetical protein [Endozoicomonadaceae bacterium]